MVEVAGNVVAVGVRRAHPEGVVDRGVFQAHAGHDVQVAHDEGGAGVGGTDRLGAAHGVAVEVVDVERVAAGVQIVVGEMLRNHTGHRGFAHARGVPVVFTREDRCIGAGEDAQLAQRGGAIHAAGIPVAVGVAATALAVLDAKLHRAQCAVLFEVVAGIDACAAFLLAGVDLGQLAIAASIE